MNKFRNEEGLTLIELLITLAVIAIVFAIAVPVFSNVLAGAQTSAQSAQAAALVAFNEEYATTDLAYANGVTTASLNGVQIASIKGDATGGASAPVVAEYVFDTTGWAVDAYGQSGQNGTSGTWSAEAPVLFTSSYDSTYKYVPVWYAQSFMSMGGYTQQSDLSWTGGSSVIRQLSAAPTAGNGAQILNLG